VKILIVGGCGKQAEPAINYLLEAKEFTDVIIGDINIGAANELVKVLQSPKASALHIDILNHRALVDAIKSVDLVLNASGPYYKLGLKVLKAAIEAGKDYVDYCDDVEPTLEMLKLSDEAAKKGITAIVGLGASPGYTNLLAMQGAEQLDQVDEVNMYWNIAKSEPEGPAVLDHMFHIMNGEVIQYLDGKSQKVQALTGLEETVRMPKAAEPLPTAFVGHPEPVTLPYYLPEVKRVVCKYADDIEQIRFFQGLQALGLFDNKLVKVKEHLISPRDLLVTQMMSLPYEDVPAEQRLSALVIEIKGIKEQKPMTVRYTGQGNMASITSIPAALGAQLLARGKIKLKGVFPPEACVQPSDIIEPLLTMNLSILKTEII